MPRRTDMPKLPLVGVWVLAAVLRPTPAQEMPRGTPGGQELRTWTDRSGTFRTEAGLIDVRVTLKKSDGTVVTIPLETLSNADRDYVRRKISDDGTASAPVEVARRAGTSVFSSISQANEVVVTGVGMDPTNALQNAFSLAIEQTVGLLVDAETLVRNDQLIRDEVLTHSRGYVEKFDVVSQRQEGELHHATIRAVVARDKLREKLRGIRIAVHDLPGERTALQIDFDAKNEEQAAEMLKKVLDGFDMTKLTKVEIVGKPEITRDGANAKIAVKIKLSPDLGQWRTFSQDLRAVLTRTAVRRAGVTRPRGGMANYGDSPLKRQLEGPGVLVSLFTGTNMLGDRTQWEMFRVPEPMSGAIKVTTARLRYRLLCVLLDDEGNDLVRITVLRSEGKRYSGLGVVIAMGSEYPLRDIWWIGPVWWRDYGNDCFPMFETTATVEVSQEDLSKVARTAVFLEEDTQ